MKLMKRGLAFLVALTLVASNVSVSFAAEDSNPSEIVEVSDTETEESEAVAIVDEASTEPLTNEVSETETISDDNISTEDETTNEEITQETTEEEITEEETTEEETTEEETTEEETSKVELSESKLDEIGFNTGNKLYKVVSRLAYWEYDLGDVCYEKDGTYTINIPEENPFFPYEVQFTQGDFVTTKWFMTPNDSVEFGGHTFYVSAYFDGETVTQMTLDVAGQKVIVYPEEKEFTDGDGASEASLLPLVQEGFTANLTGFTPVELTMVKIESLLAGQNELNINDNDKFVWKLTSGSSSTDDKYSIAEGKDKVIDISTGTCYNNVRLEIIVGDADQLTSTNTRYNINVNVTRSYNWLTATVYTQDNNGKRKELSLTNSGSYYDYNSDYKSLSVNVTKKEIGNDRQIYLGLNINDEVFENVKYTTLKIFDGEYKNVSDIPAGKDITSQIWNPDMSIKDAGYSGYINSSRYITIVTYDENGNITGCLPMYYYMNVSDYSEAVSYYMKSSYYTYQDTSDNGVTTRTFILYKGDDATAKRTVYGLYMNDEGIYDSSQVTAAYIGLYNSIASAKQSGAIDVTDVLLDYSKGYTADYSKGISFTVFVGNDGAGQSVLKNTIVTKEGDTVNKSNATNAVFTGLIGADGESINTFVSSGSDDSYGEFNYITMIVGEDVDLSNLAPTFYDSYRIYTSKSDAPEVSGKNYHDFSNGPVQYTVASEDGTSQQNYWLTVVKPVSGNYLYINSLNDESIETKTENGIVYTSREIMLDGYHDSVHNILLANMGSEDISKISVELTSDTTVLDSYWKLEGQNDLEKLDMSTMSYSYYSNEGYLNNLAKITLRAKDGIEAGSDLSGTLTIKSDGTAIMVITLTGTLGDPTIITKEIPNAVKYVPYGTMIQNSNKYSWNNPTYELVYGKLPKGMVLKENGEIYGVPKESGEFTFGVRMKNSSWVFDSMYVYRDFTLTVLDNTDENVNAATDEGYELSTRLEEVVPGDNVIVTEGLYENFVDVYIDGDKLVKGVDYNAESGSTILTVRSQVLDKGAGTHTIGIEFRENKTDTSEGTLKRAAQNYTIKSSGQNNDSGNGSDNGSESSDDTSNSGQASGNDYLSGDVGSVEDKIVVALENGYVINQVVLADSHIISADMVNNYIGQKMLIAAIIQPEFGVIIDMAQVTPMTKDIIAFYSLSRINGFADEFDAVVAKTDTISPIGYDVILNFNMGENDIEKTAYVFALNDTATGYDLVSTTSVDSIGNVAFASDKITDYIILIAK